MKHGCWHEGAHFDEEAGEVARADGVEGNGGKDDAANESGEERAGEEDGALAKVVGEPGVKVEPECCYYEAGYCHAVSC